MSKMYIKTAKSIVLGRFHFNSLAIPTNNLLVLLVGIIVNEVVHEGLSARVDMINDYPKGIKL